MELVTLGKIVNTHGIKGELKILSDFDRKDLVFKKDFNIYIGDNHIKETILSYRKHKMFDMITLVGYTNINEVLKYKGLNVYINRDDLNLNKNDYILDDLVGLSIYEDNTYYGKVIGYQNINQVLLEVDYDKKYYIPLVDEYIINVDLESKKINAKNIKGLIL